MLEKKSTKFIISCALMALSQTTGAFADGCAPKPVCPPKPCPPKPCCKPVCCPPMPEDCCERNICTPTGVITPRVDLIKDTGMIWFLTGDYTYWTARERGLEYAVSHAAQGANAQEGASGGKEYHIGNKWTSGFKVGLGTNFCHDGWDVYAEYTWFKGTSNSKRPTISPHYLLLRQPLCLRTAVGMSTAREVLESLIAALPQSGD